MEWNNVYEVTASNAKPAPGWLFKAICDNAQSSQEAIPDLAEYLIQCAASSDRTVAMKACLTIRHLADEVIEFRQFMQRCPDALQILAKSAAPPTLAQARAVEQPAAKVGREAASRALKSILSTQRPVDAAKASLQHRIQGFGNYEPPPDEDTKPVAGVRGVADSILGVVGDAVADTVDDFKEKGAVGAVRDGVLDAADIIRDSVGAVWGFLGGRQVRQAQAAAEQKQRICHPVPAATAAQVCASLRRLTMEQELHAPGGNECRASPSDSLQQAPLAQQASDPLPATGPMSMEDLLSFDDDVGSAAQSAQAPCADLLSFGDDCATGDAAGVVSAMGSADDLTGCTPAESLKSIGNDLVRRKKHAEAVKAYEAALQAVDEAADTKGLRCTIYANVALCYLQQQLYRRAVDAATRSIEFDPTYAKAYYRRCLAYKALKLHSDARKDLEALQHCRHDMSSAEMERLCSGLALDDC